MPTRRILSLWFPRLAAERCLRAEPGLGAAPFAVVGERRGVPLLVALSGEAQAAGLARGQPVRDARAMCPELVTRIENPRAEADFLAALQRWAGKFSPWIAAEPPAGLAADLTGCAHLFGGEAALLAQVEADCAGLGLTVRAGIADTLGAAWALARYGGAGGPAAARSGDAIDQEARATRSRAARRRHWERGGVRPPPQAVPAPEGRIAPPGRTRGAIAALPVAALRLPDAVVTQLARLGLRRIEDVAGQPRAGLARRFGQELVLRLDQAFGTVPEPLAPAAPPPRFAVRLTLPEPIGLEADLAAALDRLLPELAQRLKAKGRGARRVRLRVERTDRTQHWAEVGLARPTADPERLRPLLAMRLPDIEAGDGIDVVRLEAHVTEPVHTARHRGQLAVSDAVQRGEAAGAATALDDLVGRLGARVGEASVLRLHPGDSHIPEKTTQVQGAAWSEPARGWVVPAPVPRPLAVFRPEPVHPEPVHPEPVHPEPVHPEPVHPEPVLAAPVGADPGAVPNAPPEPAPEATASVRSAGPPARFRWRRRRFETVAATGPERIAPEWWLDEPDWRTGVRDYWQVEVAGGERLWLYYAHGAALSAGWFCHGRFA
ncbi:DNA polymerase Y family protein [Rhodovulum sp. 12E13]|uniref:Y-family DNA polymerase n=1 Tax=Rhodovulum sp. 12E13 TaxID=2203891 RepID=UPI001F261EE3|nr:DNA polymerase Y family protein [Rhodovulum sp. 12E13]